MTSGTASAEVLTALNTVHGAILLLTDIALDHLVDVSLVGLGRFHQRVDEGVVGVSSNSLNCLRAKGHSALMTAEIRRVGHGRGLLGLETGKAEGMQA